MNLNKTSTWLLRMENPIAGSRSRNHPITHLSSWSKGVLVLLLLCAITTLKAQEPLAQLPSPTQNEISVAATTNSITVSWMNVPSDVVEYEMGLRLAGEQVGSSVEVSVSVDGSHTFESLRPNTAYTVAVVSSTDETRYINSAAYTVLVSTDRPQLDTVEIMLPVEVDQNTLTVAWTAVTNANSYLVSIYRGSSTAALESLVDDVEITGLEYVFVGEPATQYTLQVITQGDRNNFRDSMPAEITVMTDRVVLPIPTENEIIVAATANSITLSWMNVPSDVTEYELGLHLAGERVGSSVEVSVADDDRYTFESLRPNTAYTVAVVSSADETRYIGSAAYTTMVRTEQLPQLESVVLGNVMVEQSTLTVTWTAVTNATNYVVNIYTGPDAAQAMLETTAQTTELEYVFRGEPVEQYTIEVIAQAQGYLASMASSAEAQTQRVVLPTPTENEISVTVTTNSITVSWVNVPSDVEEYELSFSAITAPPLAGLEIINVNTNDDYTIMGTSHGGVVNRVVPDGGYGISVRSSANRMRYINSQEYHVEVRTDQLPKLSTPEFSLSANSTTLLVTLTQEVENATEYALVLRVGGSEMTTITMVSIAASESTTHEFTDLMPDTTYIVSVGAEGDPVNYRNSEAAEQSVRTLQPKLERPTLVVPREQIGETQALIQWSSIENATQYTIVITPSGAENGITIPPSTDDMQSYLLSNLIPGTRYTVSMTASADNYRDSDTAEERFLTAGALRLRLRVFLQGPLQ